MLCKVTTFQNVGWDETLFTCHTSEGLFPRVNLTMNISIFLWNHVVSSYNLSKFWLTWNTFHMSYKWKISPQSESNHEHFDLSFETMFCQDATCQNAMWKLCMKVLSLRGPNSYWRGRRCYMCFPLFFQSISKCWCKWIIAILSHTE